MINTKDQTSAVVGKLNTATITGEVSVQSPKIVGSVETNGIIGATSIQGVTKILNRDYEELLNKPSIEGMELIGDRQLSAFGLTGLTAQDIDDVLFGGG